jgi:hypothetical protein
MPAAAFGTRKTMYAFVQHDDQTMVFTQIVEKKGSRSSHSRYDLFKPEHIDASKLPVHYLLRLRFFDQTIILYAVTREQVAAIVTSGNTVAHLATSQLQNMPTKLRNNPRRVIVHRRVLDVCAKVWEHVQQGPVDSDANDFVPSDGEDEEPEQQSAAKRPRLTAPSSL